MSSIPISKEGFQALEQELDRLKKERPHVIQAIKEAREEGDLKENAGYDAARERQGMLEARIKYIESRMALFNVIDLCDPFQRKSHLRRDRDRGGCGYRRGTRIHAARPGRGRLCQGDRFQFSLPSAWPCSARKSATRSRSTPRVAGSTADHRHPVQEKDRLISIPARGLVFPPCELPLRPKRPGLFPDSYMRTGNRQALRGRPIICTMPLGPSVS